jgi:hypothetical protein
MQADLRKFTVDNYPRGYPQFAALINADPAFAVFRRFGTLRARSLLYKQDELVEMEARLNELDATERRQVYLSSRRRDSNDERKKLVQSIDKALIEYGMIPSFDLISLSFTQVHCIN